jgi:hypothetical protein
VLDCYTRSGYVFIWLEGTVKLELLEGNILEEVEPSKGFFWRKRAGRLESVLDAGFTETQKLNGESV